MERCCYLKVLPTPIYTAANCRFSHPLSWGVTVFWREPHGADDRSWFLPLSNALQPDGITLRSHRFVGDASSQFVVSSLPEVSPSLVVQRIKGRLQYLVRAERPKALRRNFAIRGFGRVTRNVVEKYISDQLGHHRMADPRVQKRLDSYQISHPEMNLSEPQRTSHGLFWSSLHLVFVHRERRNEIRDDVLSDVSAMIERSSQRKGYRLREAGVLPDHVHILASCPFQESPLEMVLGFLNNLAFAQGMKPVYQFGGYLGTVGEYNFGAINDGNSAQPG